MSRKLILPNHLSVKREQSKRDEKMIQKMVIEEEKKAAVSLLLGLMEKATAASEKFNVISTKAPSSTEYVEALYDVAITSQKALMFAVGVLKKMRFIQ